MESPRPPRTGHCPCGQGRPAPRSRPCSGLGRPAPRSPVTWHPQLRRPASRRAGLGAPLVTVLVVIIILTLLGISLSFRGRSVTATVRRGILRDGANHLAASAAAEAIHWLRREANREGSPAFEFFRAEEPASLELALTDLPFTAQALEAEGRYRLEGGVHIRNLRRTPASRKEGGGESFEYLGVLRVEARTVGPRGIEGLDQADYGYRVVLTAAPRPFDLPTFMLLDAEELLSRDAYRGHANAALQACYTRLDVFMGAFLEFQSAFARLAEQLRDAGGNAAAQQVAEELAQAFGEGLARPTWKARSWILRGPEAPTHLNPDELHLFAPEVLVYSLSEEIDLGKLHLPARVGETARFLERDEPELEALAGQLRPVLEGNAAGMDPAEVRRRFMTYRDRVLAHVEKIDEMFSVYKEFQDELVEVWGGARAEILQQAGKLDWEDQVWKTPRIFRGPQGRSRAAEYLAGKPRGMVVLEAAEDAAEPLEVDLADFRGRLVLASNGPLVLRRVSVGDPSQDAVVVLAHGSLSVRGPVQAGLVSLGGAYSGAGESTQGALVLASLPGGAGLDDIFRGTLRRIEGLRSGPWGGSREREAPLGSRLWVEIGPEPVHRRVDP